MNKDDYIHFSRIEHAGEFQRLHKKTQEVAIVYSTLAFSLFGEKSKTSSIFRKKTKDSGIHEAFRAIDFLPLSKIEYTYRMIQIINSIYIYDPMRLELKVAAENPYHGTGFHTHLQTHFATTCISADNVALFLHKAEEQKRNFKPMSLT